MTDPRRKIEKFCYEHPNFGIPNLMRYIVIANVAFWLLGAVNPVLMSYLLFNPALILRGQVWRLVSFVFFPPSTGILAFIAFYFYYWIGSTLENQWGTGQFTIYFFSGVILTILYGFVMYFITGRAVSLSSTYIYLSMFFSFAALFPDMQVLFLFFIPVKMKYLALVNAAFFLISVITTAFPENLLPVVAVLNFLIFCGGELRSMLPRKQSRRTINFKRESARIRREQQDKLYTHKCAVCGRTDADYPNLEFRYCSRCAGYHCFCSEHINNHIHFTE
ncbi:MAG: hypothetical protein IJT29_05205 [Oscillospiraceae bacterium]|nr:hypothetical protein [Oscillospiraceae bacterium]